MHDTLIINIPFNPVYVQHLGGAEFGLIDDLHKFGIRSYCGLRYDPKTGQTDFYDIKSPFEKLPSSFADMAVKVYHHTKNCTPYVSLNASPKFIQGHNVYGTDYVYSLVCEMLGVLHDTYLVLWQFLDIKNAHFARIDVTYFSRLPHDDLMLPIIDMMGRISNNQRKPDPKRNVFANTRYWGVAKNRLGYCKLYGKDNEVADTLKSLRRKARQDNRHAQKLLAQVFIPELEQFAKNLLRFEATIKKDMLVKHGIPPNIWQFMLYQKKHPDCLHKLWQYWFDPILNSMKGEIMTNIDDSEVLELCKEKLTVYAMPLNKQLKRIGFKCQNFLVPTKNYLSGLSFKIAYKSETQALNAYRFYVFIKQKGYKQAKEVTNKATFNRNVKSLIDIGIPRSHLQNLNGRENKTVSLNTLITFDFSNQTPPNYSLVKSNYHGQFDDNFNHLRFVA